MSTPYYTVTLRPNESTSQPAIDFILQGITDFIKAAGDHISVRFEQHGPEEAMVRSYWPERPAHCDGSVYDGEASSADESDDSGVSKLCVAASSDRDSPDLDLGPPVQIDADLD